MVLITGANGFLGRYILNSFTSEGDVVRTLGRGTGNDIVCDLSVTVPVLTDDYNCIIHCGGKAHSIPKTDKEKKDFFDVNVTGTKNLLKALELMKSLPEYFVFISTVAVYGRETADLIDENASLNAKDAYGLSKILAEKEVLDWCNTHNVICTILRLPLLAGANPPGNLGAMIKGISRGYYFDIAGGKAKKSIVLAEDIAFIIPSILNVGGIFNLTDGRHPSFSEISSVISQQLNKSTPPNLPFWIANLLARIGDLLGRKAPINTKKLNKITQDLTFDDTKAVKAFQWNPRSVLKEFRILQ